MLEKKNVNKEYYIQQNYPFKTKVMLRNFQVNKTWENLLLADLPLKKYEREYFREKWKDTKQKLKYTQSNKEHW